MSLSLFLVLPPSILLYSISPNPRCWYRETRWSASNQRQDPSSSFASSYSWRARVEGVVLSIHFSPSLVSFVLHPPVSLELPPPPRRRFNNFDLWFWFYLQKPPNTSSKACSCRFISVSLLFVGIYLWLLSIMRDIPQLSSPFFYKLVIFLEEKSRDEFSSI